MNPLVDDLRNRVWVLERREEHARLAVAEDTRDRPGMVLFFAGGFLGILGASLVRLLRGFGTRKRTQPNEAEHSGA